jgi:hypothetical protein
MIRPFMNTRLRLWPQQGSGIRYVVGTSFATCLACAVFAGTGDWSTPVTLSTPIPPTFYTATPVVAINSTGAHAAAWINEGNYLLLQVAAQDAGASWTGAQTLSPATGFNAADPAVALSSTGAAVAMWDLYHANSSQGLVIQASTRQAHGSWGPVVSLTSGATSSSTVPEVGMDSHGNAIAIWLQTTSTTSVIETASLPSGGSWTNPVALSSPSLSASKPSLALNSAGDAIAGWQTTSGQILVAERTAGAWGTPLTIAPPAYRQGSPQVALNNRGDAAIAWTGRGTALAAIRPAAGTWSAPTTISKQSAGATARIALDDSGNAVAIFEQVVLSGSSYVYPVQAVSRPVNGSWSTPSTISAPKDYASTPNLVATAAGTFVAGWVDNTTNTVHAAVRTVGQNTFWSPANVGSGSSLNLAVAAGRATATWIGPGPAVQVSDGSTP